MDQIMYTWVSRVEDMYCGSRPPLASRREEGPAHFRIAFACRHASEPGLWFVIFSWPLAF
jgi:hypothetical protein